MNPYILSHRKRVIDIIAATIGLAVLALVAVPIAFLIRSTSPGPALYRQRRLGLDGMEIIVTKFRTMVVDAERETGPVLSYPGDSRVTGVGHWLRRTHLDEFPQWWAVLRGEMSAVGPRPERPELHLEICETMPLWSLRLRAKPGITGLAQLTTSPRELEDKLGADMLYIASASLRGDLALLARTAWPLRRSEPLETGDERVVGRLETHAD